MLKVTDVSLQYGTKKLYDNVNITFSKGNCYGIIGANGAGKSTFLKLLSGEVDTTTGTVSIDKNERMSILKQDQNAFDNETIMDTVLLGHKRLIEIINLKDKLYEKPDFSEEDGMKAAELEAEFAEMNGYEAESDASVLLSGLLPAAAGPCACRGRCLPRLPRPAPLPGF